MTEQKNDRIWQQLDCVLKDIFTTVRDIIWFWSPVEKKIHYNSRLTEVFGYQPYEVANFDTLSDVIYFAEKAKLILYFDQPELLTGEPVTIEHRLVCKNGDVRWVNTTLRRITPQWLSEYLLVGTISDIDEEKRTKNKLREKNFRDPLTGLPNRVMLEYKLQAYMESVQRNQKYLALINLDLDNFKSVNEGLGHSFGDSILRQIGDVLLAELPIDTAVFRIGGDEFALLVKNLESRADIEQIMQNIMKSLATSLEASGQQVAIQASAGIAIYPNDGETPDDLKNHVGIALKKAKTRAHGSWCYYNPIFKADQVKRVDMEKRLRRAIEKREFFLVYQPQIDVQTGKISGLEALIRWNDPIHGLVSPADFIPLAEESGLMVPIGTFVLETACAQVRSWIDEGIRTVPVAVNISTMQIKDRHFFATLRRVLAKTGISPRLLELEITESVFLDSSETVRQLFDKIREIGIPIALDDFGSGYSSLTYLKNFSLDRLKIDRTFIHDMKSQSVETAITGTIVALAHILNLEVVAEGVENSEQFEYLKRVGCNTVQGFYFCKPVSADQIRLMLQNEEVAMPATRFQEKRKETKICALIN